MKKRGKVERMYREGELPRALQQNAAAARVRYLSNPQSFHRQSRRTEHPTGLLYSLAWFITPLRE